MLLYFDLLIFSVQTQLPLAVQQGSTRCSRAGIPPLPLRGLFGELVLYCSTSRLKAKHHSSVPALFLQQNIAELQGVAVEGSYTTFGYVSQQKVFSSPREIRQEYLLANFISWQHSKFFLISYSVVPCRNCVILCRVVAAGLRTLFLSQFPRERANPSPGKLQEGMLIPILYYSDIFM